MIRIYRWTAGIAPFSHRAALAYDKINEDTAAWACPALWGESLMAHSTRTPADRPSGAYGKKKNETNKPRINRWLNAWQKKVANVSDSTTDHGILWVDGVGGFLVLLSGDVTIGQAVPGNDVEIPIVGDLSRRHIRIRRVEEMYLLEPLASTRVDGMVIEETTPLSDGDEIWLGESVQIRFRQPSPLSDSARLDVLSHHRTQPSADGILLVGQTCLLGPSDQNHVCCPKWEEQIVLSQNDDESFRFRANQRVEIDGVPAADTGILRWNANLSGSRFALRFERT